ncbi:MAG TPA: hypothetical protein VI306_08680 [Pyrinomonadaceae bacterium]
MPFLDGIGATPIIRERVGNREVLIDAFTALHGDDVKQQALEVGYNYLHS